MGQSRTPIAPQQQIGGDRSVAQRTLELSIFLTDLGWFGLLGREKIITALTIGHVSSGGARDAIGRFDNEFGGPDVSDEEESDWFPEIRRRLERYAAGETVDFSDCQLDSPPRTSFQRRVLELTRGIRFGQTMTYGELAERAGTPRAARAVGSVMASNRVPIIVPCHRVIAAGGKSGGFSAPTGVRLKDQMLAMEAAAARLI